MQFIVKYLVFNLIRLKTRFCYANDICIKAGLFRDKAGLLENNAGVMENTLGVLKINLGVLKNTFGGTTIALGVSNSLLQRTKKECKRNFRYACTFI